MNHKIARLAFVLLVGAGLIGCSPQAEAGPPSDGADASSFVVDDAGVSHAVLPVRRRVVSTIPGVTDLFVQLGASDRLVGRTRYDTGAQVAHLPSIGGGLDPDLETLTVLEPDLVVLWTDTDARSMTARISGLGLGAYAARIDGMSDFRRHARQLGRLSGLESEVTELFSEIDQTLEDIEARIGDAPRPTVLYVIGVDPPMVAGPGSFLDSLVVSSGGSNVFADLQVAWPQVSLEAIVQRDPDVVVVALQEGSYAPLAERGDGWSHVGAVKNGRVIEVDPNLFNRPGPGVAEAALTLAKALHPSRFLDGTGDTLPGPQVH